MIDKNKIVGASLIGLAIALGGGAAMAERAGPGRPASLDFAAIDADKDGKLSKAEIDSYRNTEAKAIDSDGDGLVSEAEISAMHMKNMQKIADRRAKRMIALQDADGDGKLSAAELMTRPMPVDLFTRIDADKDGVITQEELQAAKARAGKPSRGDRLKGDRGPRHEAKGVPSPRGAHHGDHPRRPHDRHHDRPHGEAEQGAEGGTERGAVGPAEAEQRPNGN